jgi:citronellol/citronellal dehydrogenase
VPALAFLNVVKRSRKPEVVADAAHAILVRDAKKTTGNFFIDEDLLRSEGVTDFGKYSVVPGADLLSDFFLPD